MKRYLKILALVAAVPMLAGAFANGATAAKAKKKSGPFIMGTDAPDDWGSNRDPALAPLGGPLGQELLEASIEKIDKKTLDFAFKVSSLPAIGGIPEITRYVWTITVDGELIQIDGKFTNYSRGACDPTAGTCPPPRDPGEAPFAVRGNCTSNNDTAVTCDEIGLVHGAFDPATGTVSVPVPLKLIKAKPGSEIANGTQSGSNFSGIWAIPSAFVSQGDMPLDALTLTEVYKVPKK